MLKNKKYGAGMKSGSGEETPINSDGDDSLSPKSDSSSSSMSSNSFDKEVLGMDEVFAKMDELPIPQVNLFKTPNRPSKSRDLNPPKKRRQENGHSISRSKDRHSDHSDSLNIQEDNDDAFLSDNSTSSVIAGLKRKRIRSRASSTFSMSSVTSASIQPTTTTYGELQKIYTDCLELYKTNGITIHNAFSLKLADVIDDLIKSKIFDKKDLTQAGHMLAASTKIFTCQVENTHRFVLQLAAIIGRNKERVRQLHMEQSRDSGGENDTEDVARETTLLKEVARHQKRILKKGKFVIEKQNLSQISTKFDNQTASYQFRREKLKEKFMTLIKENKDFSYNGEFMQLKLKENAHIDEPLLDLPRGLINHEDLHNIPFLPFKRANWDMEKDDIWGLEQGSQTLSMEDSSIIPEPDITVVFNEILAQEAYNIPEKDPADSENRDIDSLSGGHSHLEDPANEMDLPDLVDIDNVRSLDQVVDYFNTRGASTFGVWTGLFKDHNREKGHIVEKKERKTRIRDLEISIDRYNTELRYSLIDDDQEAEANPTLTIQTSSETQKYFAYLIEPNSSPVVNMDDSMEELEENEEENDAILDPGFIIVKPFFNIADFENEPWAEDFQYFYSEQKTHIQREVAQLEDCQEGFEHHEGFVDEDVEHEENIRDDNFEFNDSFIGTGFDNAAAFDWMSTQDPNGEFGPAFSELMSKIRPPKNINMKDLVTKIYTLVQSLLKLDNEGLPTVNEELSINITHLWTKLRIVLSENASKDMSFHIFIVALLHVLVDHKLFLNQFGDEYFVVSKGKSFRHLDQLIFTDMPTITKE